MTLSLIVHVTYQELQIGLFLGGAFVDKVSIDKKYVSRDCIVFLNRLLVDHGYAIGDVQVIGVTTGPGPFTTLRSVLATINGISFATRIPLISLDGLQLFLQECSDGKLPTVAFFNAYNNDMYYGILDSSGSITTGYGPVADVFQKISEQFPGQVVTAIGNGVAVYRNEFAAQSAVNFAIDDNFCQYVSLEFLAQKTGDAFAHQKGLLHELSPQYLKELTYKKSL